MLIFHNVDSNFMRIDLSEVDDPKLLEHLKTYLTIIEYETVINEVKVVDEVTGETRTEKNKEQVPVEYFLWKKIDNSLYIGKGLADHLLLHALDKGYDFEFDDEVWGVKEPIEILPKWKKILDSDFKVVEGKTQYFNLKKLIKNNRGLGQFYTSYGKTELLLSIAESYEAQNPNKNTIILVPTNKIKDEFFERAEKWKVQFPLDYSTFNTKIQLVNPMGFSRSNLMENPTEEFKEFCKNVGLVIIDEVHHFRAESYLNFINVCLTNYDYLYGVSGTVNSSTGKLPNVNTYTPKKFSYDLNLIISYLGLPRVKVSNPTQLLITYMYIKSKWVPENLKDNYMVSLNIFFNSPEISDKLVEFLKRNPDRYLFIPVPTIKAGERLADAFNQAMGRGTSVLVSAKEVYPYVPKKYSDLKDYLNNSKKLRVVIGTTAMYEGFDCHRINTIFSAVGKNQRMSVQPAGRVVRGNSVPLVIFPMCYDTNTNPIVCYQSFGKCNKLKKEFKRFKLVNFEGVINA